MASDTQQAAHRQAQILDHLVEAGQWPRVIDLGLEMLAHDPEDLHVHSMVTVAALETEDRKLADHHSRCCVRIEPGEALSHRLRARYLRSCNRHVLAKKSILEALRIEPENADVWGEYGWNCYQRGDLKAARHACEQARSLAPEDLSIEMLATVVEGAVHEPDRLTAFDQIEAYEESLRLDPECVATHFAIGFTYLEELDDGRNAVEWLRRAAMLDPEDKDVQKQLHRAVCRTEPMLRFISSPFFLVKRGYRFLEDLMVRRPLAALALLPLVMVGGVVALLFVGIWIPFLYLPGKLYEWLMFSELVRKATEGDRPRFGIYRAPAWTRLITFFVLSAGVVWAVWQIFHYPGIKDHLDELIGGGMIVGMIIGLIVSAKRRE